MYQHHIILKTKEPLDSKLVADWLKTVKDFNKDITIILVGTKVDKFKDIDINDSEINHFVQNNNLHYFETSSKNRNYGKSREFCKVPKTKIYYDDCVVYDSFFNTHGC